MNSRRPHPRTDDPLRPLHSLAAVQPPRARPVRSRHRRHQALVRAGWMLIVVGPLLALSHLIVDAPGTELTWWTGTIASYDVAVIIVIIGTALAFRSAPADRVDADARRAPSP